VVDDGSTDETEKSVGKLRCNGQTVFNTTADPDQKVHALKWSKGEYLVLASDYLRIVLFI
jgi:hypothetical protein